jgi:hypothetical protein
LGDFLTEWEQRAREAASAAGLVLCHSYLGCKLLVALSAQLDPQAVLASIQAAAAVSHSLKAETQCEDDSLFSQVKRYVG